MLGLIFINTSDIYFPVSRLLCLFITINMFKMWLNFLLNVCKFVFVLVGRFWHWRLDYIQLLWWNVHFRPNHQVCNETKQWRETFYIHIQWSAFTQYPILVLLMWSATMLSAKLHLCKWTNFIDQRWCAFALQFVAV